MKKLFLTLALIIGLSVSSSAQQFQAGNLRATGDVLTAFVPGNVPSVSIQIAGTWTGTLTFTGSLDGVTFGTISATNQSGFAIGTTTTVNGIFNVPTMVVVRVTATSIASGGPAVVTFVRGGSGGGGGGGGGGGSVTQGTDPWVVGQATAANLNATVVGTGTFAVQAAQVTAANLNATVTGGLANDGVAAATNRVATLPGLVETSAPTRTNGRNAGLSFLGGGGARVVITDDAGASQTLSQDATADSAALTTGPQGMLLGKNTTLPTAVTDGDAVRALGDLQGRLRPKNVCEDPELISSVVISTATSGNVELVAISGTTVPVVCGFNVIAGGTVGVQFIVGTGTACATNELNKTGVYPLVVNSGLNSGFGAPIFKGAAGDAVCVELSTTVQIDGILTYVSVSLP